MKLQVFSTTVAVPVQYSCLSLVCCMLFLGRSPVVEPDPARQISRKARGNGEDRPLELVKGRGRYGTIVLAVVSVWCLWGINEWE